MTIVIPESFPAGISAEQGFKAKAPARVSPLSLADVSPVAKRNSVHRREKLGRQLLERHR
jgi:hypothetical protein